MYVCTMYTYILGSSDFSGSLSVRLIWIDIEILGLVYTKIVFQNFERFLPNFIFNPPKMYLGPIYVRAIKESTNFFKYIGCMCYPKNIEFYTYFKNVPNNTETL